MCLSFLNKIFNKKSQIKGELCMRNLDDRILINAESFRYKDFVKSDIAVRLGIENLPTKEEYWENIEKLAANVLQPVVNTVGRITILSGYRSPELNKAINGSETSLHCFGCAADIEPWEKGVSLLALLEWVYYNCDFRELIAEYFPDGWVHVGYVEGYNDKKLKLKDKDHSYSVVTLDYLKSLYN